MHSDKNKFRAFVDNVRDNPDALLLVSDEKLVMDAVEALLGKGCPSSTLLERASCSMFAAEIMGLIAVVCKRSAICWQEFVNAILRSPPALWGEERCDPDIAMIVLLLDPAATLQAFGKATTHPLVMNDEHPIYQKAADAYWYSRVLPYLSRDDFRRTWDEIYRAAKGFIMGEVSGFFAISPGMLELLVGELFDKMVAAGSIQPLTNYDCRFHTKFVAGGREHAGWKIAYNYFRNPPPIWEHNHTFAYEFTEAGGKFLKLADHFRQVKNAARRQHNERRVREYANQHQP